MCEYCSKDTRPGAIQRDVGTAKLLRRLADDLEGVASGRIRPHTEDTVPLGVKARQVMRRLVNDWL